MEDAELKAAVETLLFITEIPLSAAKIGQIIGEKGAERVAAVVDALQREYDERGAGPQVVAVAGGFQMATRGAHAAFVRKLYAEKMTMRLSTAAMETLSIIAYRQPITRAEIEEVRGVEVIAALETLLEKRLARVMGRKEQVGRPLLYGTSTDFLRHFGLNSIQDLPPIDSFQPAAPEGAAAPAAMSSVEGQPAPDSPAEPEK